MISIVINLYGGSSASMVQFLSGRLHYVGLENILLHLTVIELVLGR